MNVREFTENISNEAVHAATGRGWDEWFTLLDAANGTTLSHKTLAEHTRRQFGVSGWWAQSIAGAYERVRGLRQRHEMPNGYKVSVSRVLQVPLNTLYQAWQEDAQRQAWLGDHPYTVSSATVDKSLRALWQDKTRISLMFYAKGEAKSQVVIEHSKLADADDAEARKSFWTERLDALKTFLENR